MARQWAKKTTLLFAGSLLLLAACEGTPDKQVGAIDSVEGPLGGAASDEPRATLIAQDILSAGGTAADAATALYFTLAVTYPVAGALGGGGECIVYNNEKNELENLKFPIGVPAAGGEIGIPGNIRGFAALHARYGRVAWSALLSSAETYANFGESLSRAQHMAMVASSANVRFNSRLEELYKTKDGRFRQEGEKVQQVRLASVLTTLRSNGGAHFYGGNVGKSFIEDANSAGGKLTNSDLINYRPTWSKALTFDVDSNVVGVSDSPYGVLFRDFWQALFEGKGFLHFSTDLPVEKLVKATGQSFQKFQTHSPFDVSATTSFVTADNEGNAVSCVVGLKKPFGTGKAGNITGIVMAPNVSAEKSAFPSTPLLMVNKPNKDFYYASAASGGAVATFASAYTALQVFAEGKTLESAIGAPRMFTMAPGTPLLYEKEVSAAELKPLAAQHPVQIEVNRLASVNAIFCLNGKVPNCQSRSDPRGYGLSMIQK
ncbi:MAG: gamma-glutamyltransferase [Sneathiella sp.]